MHGKAGVCLPPVQHLCVQAMSTFRGQSIGKQPFRLRRTASASVLGYGAADPRRTTAPLVSEEKMIKRMRSTVVLLLLLFGAIACSRQEDPGFEPQADSSGWNMLESGRVETPTPVIVFGDAVATPRPTAKFELPPTVTPVAGIAAGGSTGGSGGRGGGATGGGSATKGGDGSGGGGSAAAVTPQSTKVTGAGGTDGSAGSSTGGATGGGAGVDRATPPTSGGSSGGGSGSGAAATPRPPQATATPRPPQATAAPRTTPGGGDGGAGRPTAAPTAGGAGGNEGSGAGRPTVTPRPTQTPRPTNPPRDQVTPTPRGGTPEPTRTPRFTATPIPPTSTPVPIVSNAPAFNESPVYDQFDRVLLIRNMEITRDSFRSFLDSWRPILLNQRDRNRGDCGTYLGWYTQWVTQSPVFRTVPSEWAPIYTEYRVMLRDAVYITNSIRRMCPGAAADPTYRPTNEETVAWFETNYPRSEQLLTRAYAAP